MITDVQINDELRSIDGLDWITALRTSAIKKLVDDKSLQPSLFDQRDLGEIQHPDYQGERLIACKNPLLAAKRAYTRESLLKSTEAELDKIVRATKRPKRALRGMDKIGMRVGKTLGKFKVAKHFKIEIIEDSFTYERNCEKIAEESALDGIYVIRSSVLKEILDAEGTVKAYKGLSLVEQAFRSYKSIDLKVRPVYHYMANRVRAHVFICMLAYYVQWHMRQKLAPMLFDEDDKIGADSSRKSIVAPAQRSAKAKTKASTKKTEDGLPVHSFHTLLKDLATIAKARVQPKIPGSPHFDKITIPTPLQQKALNLLDILL
jgi:hypothetical protein